MKRKTLVPLLLSACLALSACNMPDASAPGANALSTAAAQTVQAVLSTPPATQPPPRATPTAVACTDSGTFTAWTRDNAPYDVDEARKPMSPNTVFPMAWTLQNTGACTWTSEYQFYFISGTPLTTTTRFPVMPAGATVPPGGTVRIEIPMSAPDLVGEYNSSFELQNERGESVITFGVITTVGTTSSQSLAAPGDLKYTYDCSTGAVNIGLIWVDKAKNEDGYRIYRDGAKLADVAADSTAYNDIAPGSGKYDYTVAAFNASGESPTRVRAETKNCQ